MWVVENSDGNRWYFALCQDALAVFFGMQRQHPTQGIELSWHPEIIKHPNGEFDASYETQSVAR